ncbi:hypothetical protein Lfu02_80610 [Longispora fulva]|uniref:DUF2637 domain-containing protein n=1 Tax=Longispora fulva TaxID=619741 RepID=A0A8J7GZA6_9ACTN|nr:hypothetical protein [Longispora fulva]MBG6141151.1 hypothetical protein [Longispora fulva]GIG63689.1 hypothetical protein Lfu02_80610 [Longispora fulva]
MTAPTAAASTRSLSVLRWVSLIAAAALGLWGEYTLAVAVGWHPVAAVAYPVALDAYLWAALAAGRRSDLGWALGLAIVSQQAAHVAPMLPHGAQIAVAALVAAVPPIIVWRVHVMFTPEPQSEPEPEPVAPPAERLAALAAELPPKGQRPAAATAAVAARIRTELPGLDELTIADALGVSTRYLRSIAPRAA